MDATGFDQSDGAALLVRELVREVVAHEAPEELPLVDRLCALDDDATVVRLLGKQRRRGDLLGHGAGATVVMATPVIWVVVNEAAKHFTNSTITGGGKVAKVGLRKLFGRSKTAAVVPALTREQIQQVRTKTVDCAVRQGMSKKRAENLADCLAGRLTLDAPSSTDDSGHVRPSGDLPGGNTTGQS